MRSLAAAAVASVCLFALAAPAAAEAGDVDGTWGFIGRVGLPGPSAAVAGAPDGTLLVATDPPVPSGSRLTRVDAAGRTDTSLDPPIAAIFVHDLAPDPRGGWIGVGTLRTDQGERIAAERFLADGRPDPAYGSGGVAVSDLLAGSAYGASVAVRPDGSAYVAGLSQRGAAPGCMDNEADVVRFTPSGALDTTFAGTGRIGLHLSREPGAWNLATSVVALPDGGADVGFDYTHDVATGSHCVPTRQTTGGAVIRYRADGTPEPTFGFNGIVVRGDRVTGLARTADQQTIATDPGRVIRYDDRGGEVASSPTNVGPSRPYVDGDGRVVAIGLGGPRTRVQRFTRGLVPDLAFGLCGTATVGDGASPGGVVASDGTVTVASYNVLVRLQDETSALDAPYRNAMGTWEVASDGGIFSFGDARFFGSTGAIRLNQPIVGMAATLTGRGYWLVASDGGVFPFGDAGFFGSAGASRVPAPIVGMAVAQSGNGYWLAGRDGRIYGFGDAAVATVLPVPPHGPVAGIANDVAGGGFWVTTTTGEVVGLPNYASGPPHAGGAPVVGMAGG